MGGTHCVNGCVVVVDDAQSPARPARESYEQCRYDRQPPVRRRRDHRVEEGQRPGKRSVWCSKCLGRYRISTLFNSGRRATSWEEERLVL